MPFSTNRNLNIHKLYIVEYKPCYLHNSVGWQYLLAGECTLGISKRKELPQQGFQLFMLSVLNISLLCSPGHFANPHLLFCSWDLRRQINHQEMQLAMLLSLL